MMNTLTIKLWDGFIRSFHWLLVVVLAGLWYTGGNIDYIDLHHQLGLVMLALLLTRIMWGFVGSQSARFSYFLRSPIAVLHYFKSPFKREYVTHNPAGAYMVLIMLVLLLSQAVSGLFTDDAIFFRGPLAHLVSNDMVRSLTRYHKQAFDYILIAIALHLVAIFVYTLMKKRLVGPMITGRKVYPEDAQVKQPKQRHGAFGFVLLGINLTWIFGWLS